MSGFESVSRQKRGLRFGGSDNDVVFANVLRKLVDEKRFASPFARCRFRSFPSMAGEPELLGAAAAHCLGGFSADFAGSDNQGRGVLQAAENFEGKIDRDIRNVDLALADRSGMANQLRRLKTLLGHSIDQGSCVSKVLAHGVGAFDLSENFRLSGDLGF